MHVDRGVHADLVSVYVEPFRRSDQQVAGSEPYHISD
jgi:hypothetical protein